MCEELVKNMSSRRFEFMKDAVHHVYIHSANFIQKFGNDFPNASELTLSKTFNQPSDSIVPSLNRIIPLRQLTKL